MSGLVPIGHVRSDYTDPDLVPPQSLHNLDTAGTVVVRDNLVDALLGLDRYEHLWLLCWLHDGPIDTQHPPLQLVPRATEATGEVQGVFASRSPNRPNPIGLSLVRNRGVRGNLIEFAGVDLLRRHARARHQALVRRRRPAAHLKRSVSSGSDRVPRRRAGRSPARPRSPR